MTSSLTPAPLGGRAVLLDADRPQQGAIDLDGPLRATDVHDRLQPALLASVDLPGPPSGALTLLDDALLAIAIAQPAGLALVDLTNPAQPHPLALDLPQAPGSPVTCTTLGAARHLAVASTPMDGGRLALYDLTHPDQPTLLVAGVPIAPPGAHITALRARGPYLFITTRHPGTNDGGITLYDLADPGEPKRLGGHHHHAAADAGPHAHPDERTAPTISAGPTTDVALLASGRLLAAAGDGFLALYDLADPAHPRELYRGRPAGLGSAGGACVPTPGSTHLALSSPQDRTVQLLSLELSGPGTTGHTPGAPGATSTPTVLGSALCPTGTRFLAACGHLLATAGPEHARLCFLDIAEPRAPRVLHQLTLPKDQRIAGLAASGRLLLATTQSGRLYVISLGSTDLAAARIDALETGPISAHGPVRARSLRASEHLAVGARGAHIAGPLCCTDDLRGRHIGSSGPALPEGAFAAQGPAGSGATARGSHGDDHSGLLVLQTGTASWSSGVQLLLTFNRPYRRAPHVALTPANPAAAAAYSRRQAHVTTTPQALCLSFGTADEGATTYLWQYVISGA